MLALLGDAEWGRLVSAEVTEAVAGELPEIGGDEVLQAAVFASNAASLELFADMVNAGHPPGDAELPPESVALAQELVRRGVGIDVLLRGYHASEASFFSHFVERVHADPRFAATASTAIEEGARWLFAFVGALTREIAERYTQERERWIRSTAAARLRDVRAVLSAEATDTAVLSARLRYPLARTHLAVVLWSDAAAAAEREPVLALLERAGAELAETLAATGTLVVALEDDVVESGWPAFSARPLSRSQASPSVGRAGPSRTVPPGSPAPGSAGFARATSRRCTRVAWRA